MVFDVRNKHNKPIYESTVRTQKHTDPVWQVRWNPDITKKFNFYSISSDGRVMNWSLMKNKLEPEEIFRLKLIGDKEEETAFIGLACGLCFDFNQFDAFSFLVGTEEGKIHKCSLAYSGQYQETYKGHLLAVYKVKWNNYHPTTFISASADWTVRIWDSTYPNSQVMLFDLGMIVVDAMWAPYSSTVFACATLDRIFVYDLNVEKHKNLADKKPVKNPKLTNLTFNKVDPIILLGDTFGGITVIKLSPNLLKRGPPPPIRKEGETGKKKEEAPPTEEQICEFEKKKMDELISLVSKWDRD